MSTPFVFTNEMDDVSNKLWEYTSIVGAAMCFVALLAIGIVALHPVSRRHLDRVSFRILAYALGANMVFGIVNAVGGSFTGPTWRCGFTIWVLQVTLEMSSFLLFCIALNMQLVIVHSVNGQKMERYYMIGSTLMSLIITIPAYATDQYGWDTLVGDCWYKNPNQSQLLAWQIGTQLFWTLLTVLGEVVTSLTVIIYMLKQRNLVSKAVNVNARYDTGATSGSSNKRLEYARHYKSVLIRIALYPLASCVINLLSVMCVLHATFTGGVHSLNDYHILLLSDFLYGGRAVVYAFLTAVDPSFLAAWRALIAHERSGKSYSGQYGSGFPLSTRDHQSAQLQSHQSKLAVQVNLARAHYDDGGIELANMNYGGGGKDNEPIYDDNGVHSPVQKVDILSGADMNPSLVAISDPIKAADQRPVVIQQARFDVERMRGQKDNEEKTHRRELDKFQRQI
ncbi:hypothetical protein BT96DRAFT_852947 [Gymnopus androsaceus JB14]|uniref:G-protein coupled receptors family 2 profile 2 domain-containing protein n=1 Tax=Gymnopus androsaceus JB14 TaxID=1447944 RepID=A0A6A4I497_9AGAR|nr:hypothetical protein BT96DRAFT_852947 [Gymnopus androsaceus JB14]